MLHELRTYTTRPGMVPELLKANETVGRKVRGDRYGKLVGYWWTDIGPLNQVMHLWEFDSFEERARLRKELGALKGWQQDYVPRIRPHIVRQEIRFLAPQREIRKPKGRNHFYEFRNYRLQPGGAAGWMKDFLKVLAAREKYSECTGAWITEGPNPNEVCHLWVYKDSNERKRVREKSAGDPAFVKFAKKNRPLIEEQHSTFLWPASFSPLK